MQQVVNYLSIYTCLVCSLRQAIASEGHKEKRLWQEEEGGEGGDGMGGEVVRGGGGGGMVGLQDV